MVSLTFLGHSASGSKNKWREGALLHLHHPACILAFFFHSRVARRFPWGLGLRSLQEPALGKVRFYWGGGGGGGTGVF